MKPQYTDEELAGLTEEERAGLLDTSLVDDDEDDDDEGGAADDGKGAAEPSESEPAVKDAKTPAADDKAAEPQQAEPKPAEPTAGTDTAPKPAEQQAPPPAKPAAATFPQYQAPADVDQKLAALKQQMLEIDQKFDDGELTAAERRAQLEPLEDQRDTLKEQRLKATMSRDAIIDTWSRSTVPQFLAAHEQYAPGSPLYGALDEEVRKLQAEADNPFDPQILVKAHEAVDAAVRRVLKVSAPAPAIPQPGTPGPRREIPPSLAHVPSADTSDADDGGEFAWLDRLGATDQLAYERELAKMSDEKRNQYLAA